MSVFGNGASAASAGSVIVIDPKQDYYHCWLKRSPLEKHLDEVQSYSGDAYLGVGVSRWDQIGARVPKKSRKSITAISPRSINIGLGQWNVAKESLVRPHVFKNYRHVIEKVDDFYDGCGDDGIIAPLISIVNRSFTVNNYHMLFYYSDGVVAKCLRNYFIHAASSNGSSGGDCLVQNLVDYIRYARDVLWFSRRKADVNVQRIFNLVIKSANFYDLIQIFNVHVFDDDDVFCHVLNKHFISRYDDASNFLNPLGYASSGDAVIHVNAMLDWVHGTGYGANVLEELVISYYDKGSAVKWICSDVVSMVDKCALKRYIVSLGDVDDIIYAANKCYGASSYTMDDFYEGLPVEYQLGVLV